MPTEKATQTSSQGSSTSRLIRCLLTRVTAAGKQPSSTTSSPNAMTRPTPITNDANRVFTLFPKLPLELRRKIWKHTLPGPRVVPICIWDMRLADSRAVSKHCASLNSSINITSVCHEARALVMETYDRILNVVWQPSYATDHESDAFVYVDYNIDKVYVEDQAKANGILENYLVKVQHVAFRGDGVLLSRDFMRWDFVKIVCPRLKSITFVDSWHLCGHEYGQESRLIEVPAGICPALTLPQLTPDGVYDEVHEKVLEEHGDIAFQCAVTREIMKYFEKHFMDQAEWKNISLKLAIHARRKIGSYQWILTYWVHGNIDNMEDDAHWHEEPVLLGDGALTSCRPVPHANHLCDDCGTQRWLQSNDAFWLCKDEREEDNRSGRPRDSWAGSAEDVTDEEPEKDVEEVTENASEDSEDNVKISTGEESDELAEGY